MIPAEEDMKWKDQTDVTFVAMTEVTKEILIRTMAGRITKDRFAAMIEVMIRVTEVMFRVITEAMIRETEDSQEGMIKTGMMVTTMGKDKIIQQSS
jgi:hypothetical protein